MKMNLEIGEMVLVVDSNAPRISCPMGVVLETVPDRFGLVQRVNVKTTTNTNIDNFGNLRNFCVMYFQTVIAAFPYALLIVSIVCHLLIQVLFQCV